MATLKASKQGLAKIKQIRSEIGWPTSQHRWLEEASLVLGVNWEEKGYLAHGISEGTWSRFLRGQDPINAPAFKAYCQVLGLSWEEVAAAIEFQDWDGAPDVSVFYGRTEELELLRQWIVQDRCRLVALLGMKGIGKTALSVKLAKQIEDEFEYLIWRSFRGAPPIQDLLADLIQFLYNHEKTDLPNTIESRISLLTELLRKHRCLLILDSWETVLNTYGLESYSGSGYDWYSELLKRIGESQHNSCLLLTSWEKPREIDALESPTSLIRSRQLTGLDEQTARDILKEKGLLEESHWEELIKIYKGNPLALKIVATAIQDLFDGSVIDFLTQNTIFLGDLEYLLYQQFYRLSPKETEIIYLIAFAQRPVSINELCVELQLSRGTLILHLQSLKRKSLIEKSEGGITLQPVIMKYALKQNYKQL